MKNLKIITFFMLTVFLVGSGCKKKASDSSGGDQHQTPDKALFDAFNLLNDTYDKFNENAALSTDSPKNAMMMTDEWLNMQDIVSHTEVYDSSYIEVTTKTGIKTSFILSLINPDSTPIYRGGGSHSGGLLKSFVNNSGACSNVIQNKKVLIYAAQFVPDQKILDYFDNSDVGFEVTLKKKEECRPELIETFKDYGLVILDTHGEPDAFMSGLKIKLKKDSINFQNFKEAIIQQIGNDNYNRLLNGNIILSHRRRVGLLDPNWWKEPHNITFNNEIWVSTKYIAESPQLTGTVVFGNMCFSGFQTYPDPIINPPQYWMVPAWQQLHPLSYYGYAYDNGYSTEVSDEFARAMEDSLVRSLVIDKDSTGSAYLKADQTEFYDQYSAKFGNLFFKHFESPSWCYGGCEDNFTDPRDGQQYKTVCIGKQRWMAENLLNTFGAGTCYEGYPSNCVTYGKLYTIYETTQLSTSSNNPSGIRGICPAGWHVPSKAEWMELIDFCGGLDKAPGKLIGTSGWNGSVNSTDEYNFSILPGGEFFGDGVTDLYSGIHSDAYFWATDGDGGNNFSVLHVTAGSPMGFGWAGGPPQSWRYSVRCVKDK